MSELENQASVDQQPHPTSTSATMATLARPCNNADHSHQENHPALVLLAANPQFFAQHGTVSTYWRRRGGKKYGPYYRLRYRDGQSSRTIYLGPQSPVVDRVRQTLQTLQQPLQERHALNQLRRQIRDALRIDRRHVDAQLRSLGLRLKGFEVRGWRTSPLRSLTRLSHTGRSAVASMQIKPFRIPQTRQPRAIPKGRAAKWVRENHPSKKIPSLPPDRLQAFLHARDRIRAEVNPRSTQFKNEKHSHERQHNANQHSANRSVSSANLPPVIRQYTDRGSSDGSVHFP
jgi:hypothetical protein